YFKLTTESVTYSDVRLVRYEDALKIKEKLDAGEDFDRLALLNSVDRRQGVRVAFRHQGLPKQVEEMLFDTLEPKKYSGIITAGEGDYRIVMLKSRFKGESKTYQELKETIEKTFHEGGIRTPETFEQWVAVMYNTGKYAVRFRFPGETTKSTSTPARKDVK
ncbi:MAG: hypothetical protein L6Q71_07345, partial [Planctomycetes bacterium]|nr:hypothetical protein [Planctomycetota bacterium]